MKILDGEYNQIKKKIINGGACFHNLSPTSKIVGI